MLRDVFEICAAYIQSLMLLFQITSAAFPSFFTSPVDVLQYVNLDLLNQFDESSRYRNTLNITIPRWVPLDFRLQFAIIAVIGPLFLSIVGMFFLGTKLFFVWFMLLLGGAFVLIIAAASKINKNLVKETILTQEAVSIAFNVGLAVTVTMVVCGLAVYVWRTLMQSEIVDQEKQQLAQVVDADMQDRDAEIEMQLGRQETNEVINGNGGGGTSDPSSPNSPNSQSDGGVGIVSRKERLDHIMQLETSEIDVVATVTRAVYFAMFFVAGLIFARLIPFDAFKDNDVFYALSGVVFFISICLLVWCLIGLFRGGREFQFSVGVWVRDNFVSMLLLLVSVVYTPAVTDIISLYSCAQVTCAAGYHLPVSLSVMASSTRSTYSETRGSSACFACNFTAYNPQQCPASLQDRLCGNATSDSRLTADVGVRCEDVGGFFITAASIMLAAFVVTLPFVYFILTDRSTQTLDTEFPLDNRQIEGYTDEEVHNERVHLSDNVAKFIFDPFTRRHQQWRLLVMLQKICLVLITIMAQGEGSSSVLRNGAIGIGLTLAVHLSYLIYVLYSTPFQRRVENILTGTAQVILCIVSIAALVNCLSTDAVPEPVWIVVAAIVVAGPILAIIVGAVLTFKDEVLREREREERVRVAQQAAEDTADDPPTNFKSTLTRRLSGNSLSRADSASSVGDTSSRDLTGIVPSPRRQVSLNRIDIVTSNLSSSNLQSSSASSPRKRQLMSHPRPKLEVPTSTSEDASLCGGSQGPLSRHRRLPGIETQDVMGRPTLVSKIRQRLQQLQGQQPAAGDLVRNQSSGSFKGSGRSLLFAAKLQEVSTAVNVTNAFLRPGGGGGGGVFGAASVNMRRTVRRNTTEESERARDNWAVAKLAVFAQLRDEREQAEKMKGKRGRQKSFMVGAASNRKMDKLRGKGKQWDQFLATLLTGEGGDNGGAGGGAAASTLQRQNSTSQMQDSGVFDSTNNDESPVTRGIVPITGQLVGVGGADVTHRTPQSKLPGMQRLSNTANNMSTPAGENLNIDSMDPLQRAKERKRLQRARGSSGSGVAILTASFDNTTVSSSHDSPNAHNSGGGVDAGSIDVVNFPAGPTPNSKGAQGALSTTLSAQANDAEDDFRAIQGGAAGRRQHILLRLKLQAIYEKQLKKLQLTQQAVDFRINKDTIFVLNNFFVFLGLFALVALALSCIGAINSANETFFTGVSFNSDRSISAQFVGYNTWSNFTAHCCCIGVPNQDPTWPYYVVDAEEWLCDNGNIKERIRSAFIDGVLRSGLDLRGLCATTFSDGCQAVVDVTTRDVNITSCSTAGRPYAYEALLW
jgi:hypothetical protein